MKNQNVIFHITATVVVLTVLAALFACSPRAAGPVMDWVKQTGAGSGADDTGYTVFAGKNVYLAGYTTGTLAGQQDSGIHDAFVTAYDDAAKALWQKQFGTGQDTYARGVYSDNSGVYVVGNTTGAFPGEKNAGNIDAFIYKLDASGNYAWVRQFGGLQNEYAYAVCGEGANIYVLGVTFEALPGQTGSGGSDIFLKKFDSAGREIWTRQFGTPTNDYAFSACADSSGVFVAGVTYGQLSPLCGLGGAEAFVRKYDLQGNEVWTQVWGTAVNDYANSVSIASGGIYVLGITYGALTSEDNRGGADVFVSRLNSDGDILWTRQFGTEKTDFAWSVSAGKDKAYITGYTSGTFEGQVNEGQYDAYCAAFDENGSLLWLKEFGTPKDDYAKSISAGTGGVFLAGSTWGSFSARSGSDSDVFMARFAP